MRILSIIVVGAAVAMLANRASAADQFDLVCDITDVTTSALEAEPHSASYPVEYRIDLTQGVYCVDKCLETSRIADVMPDRLVLTDDDTTGILGREINKLEINRISGAFAKTSDMLKLGVSSNGSGHCVAAPFKPFPTAAF